MIARFHSRRRRRVPAAGSLPDTPYILDDFTTAAAAPLTTPRTCEAGPGKCIITDTAGTGLSIADGALSIVGTGTFGQAAAAFTLNDGATGMTRAPDLCVDFDVAAVINAMFFVGLQTVTAPQVAPTIGTVLYAVRINTAEKLDVYAFNGTSLPVAENVADWVPGTAYRIRLKLRMAGCVFQISGGAFGELGVAWTTLHTSTLISAIGPLYPVINSRLAPAVTLARVSAYRPGGAA